MKRLITIPFGPIVVLVALLSACAGPPPVDSGSSNTNASQQANSNTAAGGPLVVQPLPPPEPRPAVDPVKPAENPSAAANAGNTRAPKLVAPEKKIDFGKQPQDKTLVRAIAIRNGGRAVLNIESVVPS